MKQIEEKSKTAIITIRVFQAIFAGTFALGLSLAGGDISKAMSSPISALSITTSIFGLIGMLITEIMARAAKSW